MTPDLSNLNDDQAMMLGSQLLVQLEEAKVEVERAQRRATGLRKVLDGLMEMFPAIEDMLPEDLDGEEDFRPRGAVAVNRVLEAAPTLWFSVDAVLRELQNRRWEPESSHPSNAVRSALERLVEGEIIEKSRSKEGVVVYKVKTPNFDEEPF